LQREVAAAGLRALGSLADATLIAAVDGEVAGAADASAAVKPDGWGPRAAGAPAEDPEELQELQDAPEAVRAETAALPAPTGLQVTQYGRDYLLEWKAVSHPQVAGYNVYRSFFANPRLNGGRRLNKQPLLDTSFLDTTVRNRKRKQYYRVAAVTSGGARGPFSDSVEIKPWLPDTMPPAAVSAVDAAFLDEGLSVYWEAANREPDFNGYYLYISDEQGRLGTRLNAAPVRDNLFFAEGQAAAEQPRYLAVRSVDTSGNESAYSQVVPLKAKPRIYEDVSPELIYGGFWKTERYEEASGGSITVANDAGAYVELAFNGRSVRLFTARYWSCGTADIYLDGRLVATVDMFSQSTSYSVPAFMINALKPGDHVIRLVLRGETSANPHANPTGYHFGNLDFLVVH